MAYQYIRPYIEYPLAGQMPTTATADRPSEYVFTFRFRVSNNAPLENVPGTDEVMFEMFDAGGARVTGYVRDRVVLDPNSLTPAEGDGTLGTYTGALHLNQVDIDRIGPTTIAIFRRTDRNWEASPASVGQPSDIRALRTGIEQLFRRVSDVEEVFIEEEGDVSRGEVNPLLHESRFNLPTYPFYQMYTRDTRELGTFAQLEANQWVFEPELLGTQADPGTRAANAPEHATLDLTILRHDTATTPTFASGPIRPDRPYDARFRGTLNFVWTEALSGYLEGHLEIRHNFPELNDDLPGYTRVRSIPFRTETFARAANGATTANPFGGSTTYQAIPLAIFNSEFVFRQTDDDAGEWWPYRNSTPEVEIRLVANAFRTTVTNGSANKIYIGGDVGNTDYTLGVNLTDISLDEASVTFTQLRGVEGDSEDTISLEAERSDDNRTTELSLFLNDAKVNDVILDSPNMEGIRDAVDLRVDTRTPGVARLRMYVDNAPAGAERRIDLGSGGGGGGGTFVSGLEFNAMTSELSLVLSAGDPIVVSIPVITGMSYNSSSKRLTATTSRGTHTADLSSLASTTDVNAALTRAAVDLDTDILNALNGVRLSHRYDPSNGEFTTTRSVSGGSTHTSTPIIINPRRVQSIGIGISSRDIDVIYSDGGNSVIPLPYLEGVSISGQTLTFTKLGNGADRADIEITLPSAEDVTRATLTPLLTGNQVAGGSTTDGLRLRASLSGTTMNIILAWEGNTISQGTVNLSSLGGGGGGGGGATVYTYYSFDSRTGVLKLRTSNTEPTAAISDIILPLSGREIVDGTAGMDATRRALADMEVQGTGIWTDVENTNEVGIISSRLSEFELPGTGNPRGVPNTVTSSYTTNLTANNTAAADTDDAIDDLVLVVRIQNDVNPNDYRIAITDQRFSRATFTSYIRVSDLVPFFLSRGGPGTYDDYNYLTTHETPNSNTAADIAGNLPFFRGDHYSITLQKQEPTIVHDSNEIVTHQTRYKGQLDANVGRALIDRDDILVTGRADQNNIHINVGIQGEASPSRTTSIALSDGNVSFHDGDQRRTLEHRVFPDQHFATNRVFRTVATHGGFTTALRPDGRRTDGADAGDIPVRKQILFVARPSERAHARAGDRTALSFYRVDDVDGARGTEVTTDPFNRVRSWSDGDLSVIEAVNAAQETQFGRLFRYGFGALEAYLSDDTDYGPESDNTRFFDIVWMPGNRFWDITITQTTGTPGTPEAITGTTAPETSGLFRNNWFFCITGGEGPQEEFGSNYQADVTPTLEAGTQRPENEPGFDVLAYREGRRIPTTQSYYNFINVVDTHDVRITSQGTTFYELEARPDVDIRGWRSTGVTEYEHALSAWELRQGDQTVKFRAEAGISRQTFGVAMFDVFRHVVVTYLNRNPRMNVTDVEDTISIRYIVFLDARSSAGTFEPRTRTLANDFTDGTTPAWAGDNARYPGTSTTLLLGSRRRTGTNYGFHHANRKDRIFIGKLSPSSTHAPSANSPHLVVRNTRAANPVEEPRNGTGLATDANFRISDTSTDIVTDVVLVDVIALQGPMRVSQGPAVRITLPNAYNLAQGQLVHGLAEGRNPASVLVIYEGANHRLQVASIQLNSTHSTGVSYTTLLTNAAHWTADALDITHYGEVASITFPNHEIEGFFKFDQAQNLSDTQYIIAEKAANRTYFHLLRIQGLGRGARFTHEVMTEAQYQALEDKREDTLYLTTED